jgi:hypothetical protein
MDMAKSPSTRPRRATDERSPQETERIREATLKRILNTPPKRHADMIAERKAAREKPKGPRK